MTEQRYIRPDWATQHVFNRFVRFRLSDFLRQRHRNNFSENQSASQFEILDHPFRINVQSRNERRHRMRRAARKRHNFGQGLPLRVPAAESAFVLLRHRRKHRAHESRHARRSREHRSASYRISFVRHRRRAATPFFRRLEDFRNFGLRQQRNIGRDFSKRADQQAESRCDLGDAIAM